MYHGGGQATSSQTGGIAFYNYKKAYEKVHHEWMIRVYEWIEIPKSVIKLIKELMKKWKMQLEISSDGKKMTS